MPDVNRVWRRCAASAKPCAQATGAATAAHTDVVNIGIGARTGAKDGDDSADALLPRRPAHALRVERTAQASPTLKVVQPQTTLFLVASKPSYRRP